MNLKTIKQIRHLVLFNLIYSCSLLLFQEKYHASWFFSDIGREPSAKFWNLWCRPRRPYQCCPLFHWSYASCYLFNAIRSLCSGMCIVRHMIALTSETSQTTRRSIWYESMFAEQCNQDVSKSDIKNSKFFFIMLLLCFANTLIILLNNTWFRYPSTAFGTPSEANLRISCPWPSALCWLTWQHCQAMFMV